MEGVRGFNSVHIFWEKEKKKEEKRLDQCLVAWPGEMIRTDGNIAYFSELISLEYIAPTWLSLAG